ncbi:MAG: LysM peptidoglycan-binding domain-containing protein [Litorimonas sp.]
MRQLLLVALISSLAPSAFAQVHDLSSPDALTVQAQSPTSVVPAQAAKTELQKEAERVAAYRAVMGLDNPTSTPVATPTPLSPQMAQAPLAPNGLRPMKLYESPATGAVHTVIKKDTLYNISKRYGVTVPDLQQANQLNGSAIQLGQDLLIPIQKQVVAATTPNLRTVTRPAQIDPVGEAETKLAADPGQRKLKGYAVLSGDTLTAISNRTCVSTEQLIKDNDLTTPDELNAGLMLSLPEDHCLAQ